MNSEQSVLRNVEGAAKVRAAGSSVDILNRMLRIELGASAAYEHALEPMRSADVRAAFQQNRASHADRSVMLAQLIEAAGGEPANRAGGWGVALEVVEGLGAAAGEKGHLLVILELEKQGLATYEGWVEAFGPDLREEVRLNVLTEQKRAVARLEAVRNDSATSSERP